MRRRRKVQREKTADQSSDSDDSELKEAVQPKKKPKIIYVVEYH